MRNTFDRLGKVAVTSDLQDGLAYKVRAIVTRDAIVDGASPRWWFASSGTLNVLPDRLRYGQLEVAFSDVDATLIEFPNSFVLTVPHGDRVHQFAVTRDEFWEGELPFSVQRDNASPPSALRMLLHRAKRFVPILIVVLWFLILTFVIPDARPPAVAPVQAFGLLVIACVAATIGWIALRASLWGRVYRGLALGFAATATVVGLVWIIGSQLTVSGSEDFALVWIIAGTLWSLGLTLTLRTVMARRSVMSEDSLYGIELISGTFAGMSGALLIFLVGLVGVA